MNALLKPSKLLIILLATLFISACGSTPQGFVPLVKNVVQADNTKIGFVYIAPEDKATTHIYGADCLLCYGVASALTSSLDTHLESTISADELLVIKDAVIAGYSDLNVELIEVNLTAPITKLKKFKGENGFAEKDLRVLKDKLGLDLLVVSSLDQHGAYRSFSSYIPNSDPQGYIAGTLYTVDLTTNGYVQYLSIAERVQPQGEWDEPTAF
ncbi:MAG: hypothetical protein HON44_03410, partial [Glaciecola sp.]|nr:hypothetical protein [Glaciecola sp.]